MSRKIYLAFAIFVFGVLTISLIHPLPTVPAHSGKAMLQQTYGKLPLSFEANNGQVDNHVKFLSRGNGYSLFLTPTEAVLALHKPAEAQKKDSNLNSTAYSIESTLNVGQSVLHMQLVGADTSPQVVGLEELPGKVNYFIGNDPNKWRTNVSTYAKVKYQDLYPGIDLVYYGNQNQLEYDFVVAPGADPNAIALAFDGADNIEVNVDGNLILHVGNEQIQMKKPLVYQEADGIRHMISGGYVLNDKHQIGFEVVTYDISQPLIIDPVLVYSTYFGGSGQDEGSGIAVDSVGNIYITGSTKSVDFPITNPFQSSPGSIGYWDAFVVKINPQGSELIYSTYLSGNQHDNSSYIAVDSSGNAYVIGQTTSTDFPTMNPIQATRGGPASFQIPDVFVVKLNPQGSELVYSTYLGGSSSDNPGGIYVDTNGNAYLAGRTTSANFPVMDAFQATCGTDNPYFGCTADAFVAEINPQGSSLIFSTYLGGTGDDDCNGHCIAVDATGNIYVGGRTSGVNFPILNAFQTTFGGGSYDAFVAKLNPSGSSLVYSTYLGGNGYDVGGPIAVDATGNIYITGYTSSLDFPLANPLQPTSTGGDAFMAKLDSSGLALIYSTYLGPGNGNSITVDSLSNAYVSGQANGTFPTINAIQPIFGGYVDAFVTELNPDGSSFVFSTYIGGSDVDFSSDIAIDSAGNIYVVGTTASIEFPTSNPIQSILNGVGDSFVVKIAGQSPNQPPISTTTTLISSNNPSIYGENITFTTTVDGGGFGTPTGTVEFYDDIVLLGTGTLNAGGIATFTTNSLIVGAHPITAKYLGDSIFATSTSPILNQVLNQATLTVIAENKTFTYDNPDPTFTVTYSGFVGGDTLAVIATPPSCTVSAPHIDVGNYPIVCSGGVDDNYIFSYVAGTLTVTRHTLVVTPDDRTKVYGDVTALTGSVVGIQNGDNITVTYTSLGAPRTAAVGTYPITVILNDPENKLGNYNITVNTGTLTVTPRALVATPDDKTKVYGNVFTAFTGSIVGLQNGDNITAIYTSLGTPVSAPIGAYDITVSLNDPDNKLPNYNVTIHTGTLTIAQPTLVVTPDNKTKVYGDVFTAFTGTVIGLQNGDLITATYYSVGAPATAPVGTYPIIATLNDPGNRLSNYAVVFNTGTLTVYPRTLIVTPDDKVKIYGDTFTAFTGVIIGIQPGDNINATYASAGAPALAMIGDYPIIATLNDLGGRLSNYNVILNTSTLTITYRYLVVTPDDKTKVYGDVFTTFTGTITGIQNDDFLTVNYSSAGAPVSALSGTYPITATLNDPGNRLSNYLVTLNIGTLAVSLPPVPTPTGDNVTVSIGSDLNLHFGTVTQEGLTTMVPTSVDSGDLPPNFQLLGQVYDISTSAVFTSAQTCFTYDDTGLTPSEESAIRLFHLENNAWTDVTDAGYPNTTNNMVCGTVTSFSPFAIMHRLDTTPPTITWDGNISNGHNYYFGFVPSEPTCTASDPSGVDGLCTVTGYASTIGAHTLTATARDMAGNVATETKNYIVTGWTLNGFYQPVDMNGIYNVAKNGSTIPFKFEVFAGSTELTNVADIKSFTYAQTACNANALTDEIETLATGGTGLRYEGGQFIYNWKTPKTTGCYRVTMTTIDGSSLVAYFKLK